MTMTKHCAYYICEKTKLCTRKQIMTLQYVTDLPSNLSLLCRNVRRKIDFVCSLSSWNIM
ncbi:hypothetical protein NC652_018417 [Populus alba x Populus x berolinensis]|nr:hypothetical protein NC652_018417 [Populus alba x Populus x berolinensis]